MPLSDIVQITITTQNPGVTQAGFGVPLLTSHSATWVERTRTYNGIAGVGADFATTTPEYLAANAWFSQSPAPTTVMIGRCANKPSKVSVISISTVVSTAGTKYAVNVYVNGVLQTATFTTVGADTNDSIVAGLVAAINALAAPAPNFTAASTGTVGSKVVTCTGNATGNWFAVEPLDVAVGAIGGLMAVVDNTADPGIVADLTAINTESSAWYGLNMLFKGAMVAQAASWVESNTKLFPVALSDTAIATAADSGATDVAHQLKASAYSRTAPFYHPRAYEFVDCAETGRFFPLDPGKDNWRLKTLVGPTPVALTSTQITNLKAKYCNFYYVLGGVNVIGGDGKVSANEYIDVIRGRDWYAARLQERLANLLIQNNKIPYTDAGIALVEAQVRAQNAEGIAAGVIAPGTVTVSVPAVSGVSSADKQNRVLNNVNTSWTLAGALNKLNCNVAIQS